jgi:4-amino-4-deoxy-L-arabinose transferase-like glycosyltransferase
VKTHNLLLAVGAAALMVPVLLAALVFPATMVDTRELFAWGTFYPLTMLKHPPLPAWIAGIVSTALPANAIVAILAGQILNLIGFAYFHAILRPLTGPGPGPAAFWTFLFATSLYFMLAPLSYALNNDILQVPVWLAFVFHALRAHRTNAWGHWLALGIWAAAAVLIKYSAAILFAAALIATFAVPEYRRAWRNPRIVVPIAVGLLLIMPHLNALRTDGAAIGYAATFASINPDFAGRLYGIGHFLFGAGLFLLPAWLIISGGLLNGNCRWQQLPQDPANRSDALFIATLTIIATAITFMCTLTLGSALSHRYGAPYFGLFLLSAAPLIGFRPETFDAAQRSVAAITAVVAGAILLITSVVYLFITSHNYMQEPIEEATALMRGEWNKLYTCGPGYALGDRSTAHGIATAGDRHPWGVPMVDVGRPPWWNWERLAEEGAIIAYRSAIPVAEVMAHLPSADLSGEKTVSVPLARTMAGDDLTYHYVFIPPRACAIAPG